MPFIVSVKLEDQVSGKEITFDAVAVFAEQWKADRFYRAVVAVCRFLITLAESW